MAVTLTNINTVTGATEGEHLAISYSLLKLRATDESANTDGFLLTEGAGGSLSYTNSAGVLTAVDFGSGAVVLRAAGLYINNVLVTGTDARLYWLSGDGIQAATDTSPFPIGDAFFVRALDTTSGTWGSSPAPTYDLSATPISVTVSVTPTGINDAAVIAGDLSKTVAETDEALTITGTLTSTDVDNADNSFTAATIVGTNGTFSIDAFGAWAFIANSAFNELSVGELKQEIFNVTSIDGTAATVTVTITGTNDTPVAVAATNTAVEDGVLVEGQLVSTDLDVLGATATYTLDASVAGLTLNANGSYSFDPSNAAYQYLAAGETLDVVAAWTVTDDQGASDTSTLTITVTGTNDIPVAVAATDTAVEDAAPVTGQLESSDLDVLDTTATYTLDAEVAGLTLNEDGSYSFDPSNAAYQYLAAGETLDVVAAWTVTDDQDASASSTLTITITGTNDIPVVTGPVVLAAIVEDSEGLIFSAEQLLANSSDFDLTDRLSVADVALADEEAGTLTDNEDGTWTFVPAANFNGNVTFNYTVSDGQADPVPTSATLVVANDYADVSIKETQPAQEGATAVAQISSITLTGTAGDIADTYTVVINGETVFYETTGDETSLSDIAAALSLRIVADFDELLTVTVVGNVITLTAKEAGTGFILEAEGINATVGADISTIDPVVTTPNAAFVAGQAQVSSVTIAAETIEIGDRFSVTINGTTLTYEANGTEESVADIARALRDLIEADDNLIGVVSSVANGAVLTVTALVAGTAFDIDAAAFNATAGEFVSTAIATTPTPNVVAVEAKAQSSTVAFGETRYDQGDLVTVTINGVDFSYAVQYGDTANTIRDALAVKINLDNNLAVSANGNVEGVLTIVADVAGDAFIVASTVVDVAYVDNADPAFNNLAVAREAVAQQATITLDAVNAYDRGDIIIGKINGFEFEYEVTGSENDLGIALQVAQAINTAADGAVIATVNDETGIITITANTVGVEFTLTDVDVKEFAGTVNELIVPEIQANDVADKQITEFSLSGTPDVGDELRVTINSMDYMVTAELNDTAETLLSALAAAINLDVQALVSAQVVEDKLVVTADVAGTAFSFDRNVTNATATANSTTDNTDTTAVASTASTAQVSTVKFDSSVGIGDVYTVMINETIHSFTAVAGSTLISVLNALVNRINSGVEKGEVTAVRSGSTLIVSSDEAGNEFTIAATDSALPAPVVATPTPNYLGESGVAQVSRVDLGQAAYDKGDMVNVTVAGTTYEYTVLGSESSDDIVDELVALMLNDATVFANNDEGQLQLTAKVAGTAFVFDSSVANVAFTANTLTHATTTANDVADAQSVGINIGAAVWDAGDVISGTLNGFAFSYTVTGNEADNQVIAVLLAAEIADTSQPVTISIVGNTVVITANVPGNSFELVTNVDNTSETDNSIAFDGETVDNVTAQAQVSEVDLGAAGYDAGDVITLTVGGIAFSYTVTGEEANNGVMVAALLQAINADIQLAVTASLDGANVNGLVLTANADDGEFTLETAVSNAGIADQVAGLATDEPVAEVIAVKQVTSATLAAVGDIGDEHSFTFTDNAQHTYTVTYTVDGTEANLGGLTARIISAINGTPAVAEFVTALPGDAGQILFQADVAGIPFTVTSAIDNQPEGANDNGLDAGETNVVDNATATQQVSTLTLNTGALDAGDVVNVTIHLGQAPEIFMYTVQVGDSLETVLNWLVLNINDTESIPGVTASTDGLVLTLTEDNAATGGFTVTGSVNDVVVGNTAAAARAENAVNVEAKDAVAQSVTLTPDADALNPGDVLSVTLTLPDVGPTSFTVTYTVLVGDTLQSALAGLASAVAANVDFNLRVTAAVGTGVLTLTANNFGTEYEFTSDVVDVVTQADATAVRTEGAPNQAATDAVKQVSTVTLSETGALDAGDYIVLTVAGSDFSYTVNVGDTLADVMAELVFWINVEALGVTASTNGAILTLTADTAGTGFSVISNVINATVDDSAATSAPETTAAATATPQESSVTFSGSFDQGDTATVTINDHIYSYSVQAGDNADAVVNGLIAAVAANEPVTLVNSGNGVLTLTANNAADGGFTVSAEVGDITKTMNDANATVVQAASGTVTAVSQVSTVTFGDGTGGSTVNIGETYTVFINDVAHTYTAVAGATMITVLNALRSRINAGDEGDAVTAVRSGTKLIISADTAGNGFTLDAFNSDVTAAVATPTANVVGSEASVEIARVNFGTTDYDAGDTVTLNINGNTYTVTVTEKLTADALVAKLVTDITSIEFSLSAHAQDEGVLVITGDSINDPLNVSVDVINALTTDATQPAVELEQANVAADVAQLSSITLSGTYNPGDIVTVKINGADYSYTVKVLDSTNDVVSGLLQVMDTLGTPGVEPIAEGTTLELKATTAGGSFTVSSLVTQVVVTAGTATPATTTANAATTEAQAQVDNVTLTGPFDAGDIVTVTIGGTPFSYTTSKDQLVTDVVDELVALINAGDEPVTAANDEGVLTLTADEAGTSFTAISGVTQVQVADGELAVGNTPAAGAVDAQAQVDTITLSGTFDAGDIVTVSFDIGEEEPVEFSYTVQVGDGADVVGAALAEAIHIAQVSVGVTAAYDNILDILTLTAVDAGTPFTATSGVTQVVVAEGAADEADTTDNIAADVAQVTTVNFVGANTREQGDTFTLVIDGQTISYTTDGDEGWGDILSALGDAIDTSSLAVDWELLVGGEGSLIGDFTLQLTAAVAGTPFTVSASATNRPAGEINTPAVIADDVDNVGAVTPIAQISTIDLGNDTLDAGDVVRLTINEVVYDYTVTGQEVDNSAIVDALVLGLAGAPVSASNVSGTLQLTGNGNGSTFTVAAVINNIALQTNAGQVVVDDTTTPNVDAVLAEAQQSTVTFDFAGGNEPGDTYRITLDVDGEGGAEPITVEYVTIGDETLAQIADTLRDLLSDQSAVSVTLVESVANSGNFDQLLFAATVTGTPFTVTSEAINRPEGEQVNSAPAIGVVTANVAGVEAVAQQSTVTLTGADFEAGDTYSITIDADGAGVLESFTVSVVSTADETLANIAQALQEAIESQHAPLTVTTQESVLHSGNFDQLLIVAKNVGTPFTVSSTVTNRDVGAADDNSALAVTTQDNVEAVAEQAQVSLVDFQENLITGDTLYINIDHDGVLGIDNWFSAQLGADQTVNDLLLDLQTQIETAGIGFSADVDGTQISLTGVAANAFTLEAGYSLFQPM
ncbi:MAG: VCBS domain-containing protein [Pseudomonas sp.]|nr:VCBS domain-containing protein [Pseudomonas sp.]